MKMSNRLWSGVRSVVMVAGVAALVAGCATAQVGRDFAYGEFAARAKQGETTRTEVEEWLGAPAGRGLVLEADGSRNDQWTYYHGSAKLPSGSDTRFKLLQVKFNAAGKLLSYTWSGEAGAPAAEKK
jgi:hypothetical protein